MLQERRSGIGVHKAYWTGSAIFILLALLLLTVGWQLVPERTSDTVVGAGQPGASGYAFVGRVDQEVCSSPGMAI